MLSKLPFSPFSVFFSILIPSFLGLPDQDTASIQPLVVNPTPTATIPAFPEQSETASCPLQLSDDLFRGIKAACGVTEGNTNGDLHRSRCCPVLAAWLYSAYSATALGRASTNTIGQGAGALTSSYDMPLLPDDSETCVNDLGVALNGRGIQLIKPNETCDLVSCYCGIRLRPLSCPESFSVTHNGKLKGDEKVTKLERNCLSSSSVNGFPGLGGCSACLNSLYLLNQKKTLNASKSEDRTTKMHNKDCQLMGLTWLLATNRTAYIHTVTNVLRAIMLSPGNSTPQSCTLNSDGMPLPVDSSEISNHSSSRYIQPPMVLSSVLLSFSLMFLTLVSTKLC